MSVFIDTSAILAVFDADDPRHSVAASTWTTLAASAEDLVTSNYVVLETVALLHRRFGSATARVFTEDMVPAMELHWVDETVHDAATSAALAQPGKSGASLVDCVSFEIIRRAHIESVFAYDKHFRSMGYQMIG